MKLAKSPGALLVVVAHVCAAILALVLFAAMQMPSVGIGFVPSDAQIEVIAGNRAVTRLDPSAVVVFRSAAGEMRQTAGELVPDHSPDGTSTAIAAWFAGRDRLASIIAVPATLALPDGRILDLAPQPHTLQDLSPDVWMLLVQGSVVALLGGWLVTLRPRDWGARMFLVSCLGLAAASWSGALYDARAITADGGLLQAMQLVNFTGSIVSAAGLLALYTCQPRQLVPPRVAVVGIGVAAAWGIAAGAGLLPLAGFYAALLVCAIGFVAVLAVQWRMSHDDPGARAALRWVGVVSLVGTGQLSIAMAVPHFFDVPSFGGDGMTIVPLLIVYGSIAFGIGSNRLFDLDRWTYRVILGALAALSFLLVDAAIVAVLHVDGPVAFALAMLFVGYLYLPLRTLLWHRIIGRPPLKQSELFQIATEVAFAASPGDRREGWRALLRQLFDPLDITAHGGDVPIPTVIDGGAALVIPATTDEVALRLGFHAGGRRIFGQAQVAMAREVLALMQRAEAARAEYGRGVDAERQRIARDLHDDVCALLLTSLHRDDVAAVRGDVRGAMAEIRTVISGLTGERLPLDQVIADLRFETAGRLAAAGIALDWPLPEMPLAARLLDYRVYKTLIASHREVISNVIKHACASRVTVTVTATDDAFGIDVVDDGSAVDGPAPTRGHGLNNLERRLAEIGGELAMSAARPGRRVDIIVPLD